MMAKEFYFVSDLHFGGDGSLMVCDFTEKFIEFLRRLAQKTEETELIIAGDTFGFWELTTVAGTAQLDEIIKHHAGIFEQFILTGEKIRITMMVGNHDYDLACDPVYTKKLRAYNIHLDTSLELTREVGNKKIWIEHGQQIDPYNAATEYGNIRALPLGYFITESLVSGASKYSVFGASDWLKDIRSVDVRSIPDWLVSNYFYHEMNLLLRWLLVPFLLLLTITAAALIAQFLQYVGVFDVNVLLDNPLVRALGLFGNILSWIITASMFVWFFVIVVSVPLYIIYRDIRRTLFRMQLFPSFKSAPTNEANNIYLERARAVFRDKPEICSCRKALSLAVRVRTLSKPSRACLRNQFVAAKSKGTVTKDTSASRQSSQNIIPIMAKIITKSPRTSITPEVKSSLSASTSEVIRVIIRPTGYLS